MLKHATLCRTNTKAQQSFNQGQSQQEVQARLTAQTNHDASSSSSSSNGFDVVDGALPSPITSNWFPTSKFISSSCCASPTPPTHLSSNTTFASMLSSAPPSVFNSPSKQHYDSSNSDDYQQQPIIPIRTQSNTSTTNSANKSADSVIKIFAQTLSQEVEYVTLHVNAQTKCQQIIRSLLKKFRLKHRDPNLFYLTLERWIRKDGLKTKSVMLLGDEACPLQLQQCCSNPPHKDIKFTLQMRVGALMKIYCSDVCPDTRYKCLSLSSQTTVKETIELMLHCLNLHNDNNNNPPAPRSHLNRQTQTTHHHIRQASSPADSSTSSHSTSSSSSSTSSGIDSDPTNHLASLSIIASPRQIDLNSRASSVNSISSSSNISNNSSLLVSDSQSPSTASNELYCLVIECKDTSYRRVLDLGEFLVDVYQNLMDEVRQEPIDLPGSHVTFASLPRPNKGLSPISANLSLDSANSDLMKQQPDQWFVIKLKRRDKICLNHLDLIKSTNPHKQMMPLPPIPQSLSSRLNNTEGLKHIVSTTQIEVNNRPNSSLASLNSHSTSFSCSGKVSQPRMSAHLVGCRNQTSGICRPASGNNFASLQSTIESPTPTNSSRNDALSSGLPTKARLNTNPFIDDSQAHYGNAQQIRQHHHRQMSDVHTNEVVNKMSLPPASLVWLPPVKPRKRNLSNASSTFQRPQVQSSSKMLTSANCNRRRYDPVQLAKDLNELDLGGPASPVTTQDDRNNNF